MSKSIKDWIKSIEPYKKMADENPEEYYGTHFFRDPLRPQMIDCDHIYSPADGVIVDQGMVEADEEIVDIKGIQYTPQKLLEDETFDKKSLVISIFMSQYNVHVNRLPTDGNVFWKKVAPLQTLNKPMLFEERDIMKGQIDYKDMGYPTKNGRMINTIYNGRYTYYLIQICDPDVSVIAPFDTDQGVHYSQNERFSVVRYGSQVTLILPIVDCWEFVTKEEVKRVVEGGVDKLVHLKPKKSKNKDK